MININKQMRTLAIIADIISSTAVLVTIIMVIATVLVH